jgi:hypothetical protein
MEISYGFSRFGRYSYDIVEVLETMGHIFDCDKAAVLEMAKKVREMILLKRGRFSSTHRNGTTDDSVGLTR